MRHIEWSLTGHGGIALHAQGWLPVNEPRDVIAISGGRLDGVDNGTVFSIWRNGSHRSVLSGNQ